MKELKENRIKNEYWRNEYGKMTYEWDIEKCNQYEKKIKIYIKEWVKDENKEEKY